MVKRSKRKHASGLLSLLKLKNKEVPTSQIRASWEAIEARINNISTTRSEEIEGQPD